VRICSHFFKDKRGSASKILGNTALMRSLILSFCNREAELCLREGTRISDSSSPVRRRNVLLRR